MSDLSKVSFRVVEMVCAICNHEWAVVLFSKLSETPRPECSQCGYTNEPPEDTA